MIKIVLHDEEDLALLVEFIELFDDDWVTGELADMLRQRALESERHAS